MEGSRAQDPVAAQEPLTAEKDSFTKEKGLLPDDEKGSLLDDETVSAEVDETETDNSGIRSAAKLVLLFS